MRSLMVACMFFLFPAVSFSQFGLAENALSEFKSIKFENIYTKVPTSGKLISIRIDGGTTYYICREKSGYAIYHLETRPMVGFKERIEQELRESGRKWDKQRPDELLYTKEAHEFEMKKLILKYSEAVWVRNEIVVENRDTGQ